MCSFDQGEHGMACFVSGSWREGLIQIKERKPPEKLRTLCSTNSSCMFSFLWARAVGRAYVSVSCSCSRELQAVFPPKIRIRAGAVRVELQNPSRLSRVLVTGSSGHDVLQLPRSRPPRTVTAVAARARGPKLHKCNAARGQGPRFSLLTAHAQRLVMLLSPDP